MTLVGSRRHARPRWLLLLIAVVALSVVAGSIALAAPSNYLQYGDTNIRYDGSSGTFDWANSGPNRTTTAGVISVNGTGGLFDGGTLGANNATPPGPPSLTAAAQAALTAGTISDADFIVDPISSDTTSCGSGDPSTFAGAGSETNGGLISTFTYGTSGNTPPKNDLSNVYAMAANSDGSEIFFGAERIVNNGDSHIDFEFLQAQVKIGPSACSGTFAASSFNATTGVSINNRTQGDMLLSVDFTNGGAFGGATLYRWQCDRVYTSTNDNKVCNPPASGKSVPHYEPVPAASPLLDNVKFAVNAGATALPGGGWVHRNSDGSPRADVIQNAFMEGAIDLTGLDFDGCIQTLLPHTRSSQSFTAVLKDFAAVEFDTCRTPSVTTQVKKTSDNSNVANNATVPVGTSVYDTASLSNATPDAGGTVTYRVFTDNTCETEIASFANTKTVTNGTVPQSDALVLNTAQTYYFQATYSGDTSTGGKNRGPVSSGCLTEVVTAEQFTPTITTSIKLASDNTALGNPANGTIPTTVYDTATLTNASPTAGGTVTYRLYTNSTCTTISTAPTLGAVPADGYTVTVTIGVVPQSANVTFNAAGTWYFQASYSGDAFNVATTSACTSEQIIIAPNTPSIATSIKLASDGSSLGNPANGTIPTTVYDTATLTNATANAGGTVTYRLYTNSACTTISTAPTLGAVPANGYTVTVTNGVVPQSANVTFNAAGTWYFQATYSGDANNTGPVSSACTSETIVVAPNTPALATTPAVQINDSATLTGLTSDAGGTLTFYLFAPTNPTCDFAGAIAFTDARPVTATAGSFSASTAYQAATSGTWRWVVKYTGDGNNTAVNSGCNEETVDVTITVRTASTVSGFTAQIL
jgi:hypothetical protein